MELDHRLHLGEVPERRIREELEPAARVVVDERQERLEGVRFVRLERLDEREHHAGHDGRLREHGRVVRQAAADPLQAQQKRAVGDGEAIRQIRHRRVRPFGRQRLVRLLVVGQAQHLAPRQQAVLLGELAVHRQQIAKLVHVVVARRATRVQKLGAQRLRRVEPGGDERARRRRLRRPGRGAAPALPEPRPGSRRGAEPEPRGRLDGVGHGPARRDRGGVDRALHPRLVVQRDQSKLLGVVALLLRARDVHVVETHGALRREHGGVPPVRLERQALCHVLFAVSWLEDHGVRHQTTHGVHHAHGAVVARHGDEEALFVVFPLLARRRRGEFDVARRLDPLGQLHGVLHRALL